MNNSDRNKLAAVEAKFRLTHGVISDAMLRDYVAGEMDELTADLVRIRLESDEDLLDRYLDLIESTAPSMPEDNLEVELLKAGRSGVSESTNLLNSQTLRSDQLRRLARYLVEFHGFDIIDQFPQPDHRDMLKPALSNDDSVGVSTDNAQETVDEWLTKVFPGIIDSINSPSGDLAESLRGMANSASRGATHAADRKLVFDGFFPWEGDELTAPYVQAQALLQANTDIAKVDALIVSLTAADAALASWLLSRAAQISMESGDSDRAASYLAKARLLEPTFPVEFPIVRAFTLCVQAILAWTVGDLAAANTLSGDALKLLGRGSRYYGQVNALKGNFRLAP